MGEAFEVLFDAGNVLERVGVELTALARRGDLEPVRCRDAEVARVVDILLRQSKNNPALIGKAGVGKTAIVEGLAQRIAAGDVPPALKDARILALDHVALLAGTAFRGQYEERIRRLVRDLSADPGRRVAGAGPADPRAPQGGRDDPARADARNAAIRAGGGSGGRDLSDAGADRGGDRENAGRGRARKGAGGRGRVHCRRPCRALPRPPAPFAARSTCRARWSAARGARASGDHRARTGRRPRGRDRHREGDRVAGMRRRWLAAGALLGWVGAGSTGCQERAQEVRGEAELRQSVQQMMPAVERATRLRFKQHPVVLRRSRAQVRDYVIHKFDDDLPPAELAGAQAAYRLFGLIPDSLNLRRSMVNLLTEQVAGYFDPDSNALYIPTDIDPSQTRLVISHELVHALQHQYLNLDSLVELKRENDRRTAAQYILEGQAKLD